MVVLSYKDMRKYLVTLIIGLMLVLSVQGLSTDTDEMINKTDSELAESMAGTVEGIEESLGEEIDTRETEKYILFVDYDIFDSSVLEELDAEIRYEYSIIDGVAVEAPKEVVDNLESLDFIESVEPDPITTIPLPEDEGSGENTESYSGGEGSVIAVLDTGIDDNHVDLEGEVVEHRDFTGSGQEDRHGHGTHVAGIAAGRGEGSPEYTGVAPEADLMNVKVLHDDGSGRASDAIRGIEYSVENHADVIVMSLGVETECDGTDPLSQAADNAVEEGIPTVVSAGNSGPDYQTITSPGCGNRVLTVGASGNNQVASFSSRGETDDGRMKPEIVAPGVNIYAPESGTRDSYTSKSGTSMSAPYAAGAVTLLFDEYNGEPAEYFEALTETAYSLNTDERAEGSGQINITAARDYWNRESSGFDSEKQEEIEERERVEEIEDGRREEENGREYLVYEGETSEGRKAEFWIDAETGQIDVRINWIATFRNYIELLIERII